MTSRRLAIALTRVSTDAQGREERGGLPGQRAECERIAVREGLAISDWTELRGVSGTEVREDPRFVALLSRLATPQHRRQAPPARCRGRSRRDRPRRRHARPRGGRAALRACHGLAVPAIGPPRATWAVWGDEPTALSGGAAMSARRKAKPKRFDLMDWWYEQMPWTSFADIRRAYRLGLRHGRQKR